MPVLGAKREIPTQGLEQELLKDARPGVFGNVEVEITIPEHVASDIEFSVARRLTVKNVDPGSVSVIAARQPNDERVDSIRQAMMSIRDRLCLLAPTRKLLFHFADGKLVSFELEGENPLLVRAARR